MGSPYWSIARVRGRRPAPGRVWMPRAFPIGSTAPDGFTQFYMTGLNPPSWRGADLRLSWTSTAPAGTIYQVYLDGALAWSGTQAYCTVPMPQGLVQIDVGTVGPAEGSIDYSASLPSSPQTHANLSWTGGTYLGADIAGFRVFGGLGANEPVNYSNQLADIPVYTPNVITDGFGMGGYGYGGYGLSSASYNWKSASLTNGTWNFAVVPYDTAGNLGTGSLASVAITAPPLPPAPYAGTMIRMLYTYNAGSQKVTLNWNASS